MSDTMSDPTPEEIAEMCAEIRAGWSEADRQRRMRADWKNRAPEPPRQGRISLEEIKDD